MSNAKIARSVDEQVALPQRQRGPCDLDRAEAHVRQLSQREQQLRRLAQRFVARDARLRRELSEEREHLVRERDLPLESVVAVARVFAAVRRSNVSKRTQRCVVQLSREKMRSLFGRDRLAGRSEMLRELLQRLLDLRRDRKLVEARPELHVTTH